MATWLFVVHGSHPSAAVEKALDLKGADHRVFEWAPPTHALGMRALFGGRTVPGIRFDDGAKVQGSVPIMEELERRYPDPPLYPSDPDQRAAVVAAEHWGEATFQPVARRIIWPAFARDPVALHSFQQGSRLPALPLPVIKVLAPGVTAVERRLNDATDDRERADLEALPGQLDRIDQWIAHGVLGGALPNAADLQIGATVNLLLAIEDLQPLIEGRPTAALAHRNYEPILGRVPAGTVPMPPALDARPLPTR
jgi:glutathione S-transferase